MWQYSYNLRGLYETPSSPEDRDWRLTATRVARSHRQLARRPGAPSSPKSNRNKCSRPMASPWPKRASPRLPTKPSAAAEEIGYPVVLKLHSETITHKTDVGGVQLEPRRRRGRRARPSTRIQTSVTDNAGAQHFHGVTVQPMIKLAGLTS